MVSGPQRKVVSVDCNDLDANSSRFGVSERQFPLCSVVQNYIGKETLEAEADLCEFEASLVYKS